MSCRWKFEIQGTNWVRGETGKRVRAAGVKAQFCLRCVLSFLFFFFCCRFLSLASVSGWSGVLWVSYMCTNSAILLIFLDF